MWCQALLQMWAEQGQRVWWGEGGAHCTLGLAPCSPDSVGYLGDEVPACVCQLDGGCGLWPLSPQGSQTALPALGGGGIFRQPGLGSGPPLATQGNTYSSEATGARRASGCWDVDGKYV